MAASDRSNRAASDRSTTGRSGAGGSTVAGSTATGLLVDVGHRPEPTKSLRLQAEIRDAIRSGRLQPGGRLPSSRALAADLGWARNVVVDAYQQLTAEGYLTSRVGQGTTVADRPAARREPASGADRATQATATATPGGDGAQGSDRVVVDLQPGLPDLVGFPLREWRRSVNAALDRLPASELGYRSQAGAPALRQSLARYLNRARATDIGSDQIVVTTGVSAALRLVAAALGSPDRPVVVAVEDPGAYTQWDALRAAGAEIVAVPVDRDGIDTAHLATVDADVVVTTPAHQYPLGGVLTPERRASLIAWARARPGRLLVEDDYDAEFRYDRHPIGSIQGTAPDVTAITSSVSKTLAPGMRLGWIGLPLGRVAAVAERLVAESVAPDAIQQHGLADLIDSGRYDRIIRRQRRAYGQRRRVMIDALLAVDGCRVRGAAGGLHLTVLLPDGVDDTVISRRLLAEGIDVPPLSRYRLTPGAPGLVASFAAANPAGIELLVDRLAAALASG